MQSTGMNSTLHIFFTKKTIVCTVYTFINKAIAYGMHKYMSVWTNTPVYVGIHICTCVVCAFRYTISLLIGNTYVVSWQRKVWEGAKCRLTGSPWSNILYLVSIELGLKTDMLTPSTEKCTLWKLNREDWWCGRNITSRVHVDTTRKCSLFVDKAAYGMVTDPQLGTHIHT